MKNSFKIGFLALVIATSAVACKGKGSSAASDSLKRMDSLKQKLTILADSMKKSMAADSAKAAADTSKKK